MSAEELEQWEISHTELGCLYVEYTQKQLQRFRNSQTAELDLGRVETSKSVQVFKKPMMTFLEKSDLYIAHQILELLPDDYLHQQRCLLLARIGRYKDAFELAVGQLNDIGFAERVAIMAIQWKPENKKIYTHMHGALMRAGHKQSAKQLLNKYFKLVDFVEVTKNIDDDDLMDEDFYRIYQKAFIWQEKQEKRAKIQLNLASCQFLKTKTEEHARAANVYFNVTDETQCSQCFAKIMKYPFSYLPDSQTVIHTHHLH